MLIQCLRKGISMQTNTKGLIYKVREKVFIRYIILFASIETDDYSNSQHSCSEKCKYILISVNF